MSFEVDRMTPKRQELMSQLAVGSRVYAKESFSLAEKGARGWVWECYELGGRPGVSIVFENGQNDGFAPGEAERFILPEGSAETSFFASGRPPRSIHEALKIAERVSASPFQTAFGVVLAQWEAREIEEQAPAAAAPSRKAPRV